MKRTSLYIGLMLTTVALTSASRAFGDSKNRNMSGGAGRGHSISHNGPTSGNNSGTFGQNNGNQNGNTFGGINLNGNHNNHANSESQHHGSGGMKTGVGFNLQNHGINLPQSGNHHNGQNSNQSNIHQPSNLQTKIGHAIHLANGTKTHAIGINLAQTLKHKSHDVQVQSQVQNICGTAPKHLCNHSKFSWWVNVCYDHCHANYGCWNVNQQYWDCWTPCNWQVVQCQQFSYFVGLNATYIPEMQAYGVQSMVAGSPAQLSGLLPGDLIVSVNGQTVFDANLINNELVRGRLDMQVVREGLAAPIQLTVFPRLVQTVSF